MSVQRDTTSSIQAALLQGAGNNRILLKMPFIRIGRGVSGESDIIIAPDDTQVSREHARLILEVGRWSIEDCSRNGTIVNDETLHGTRVILCAGDRIQIGRTFDYTFKDLNVTDASPTAEPVGQSVYPAANAHETPPTNNGIWISPSAAVWRDGVCLPANLSRTEYRLLKFLSKYPCDVCDYETTIQSVWGKKRDKDSLHELIYRIRRKIEVDPAQPKYLIIRAGIGVVFFPLGSDGSTR